MARQVNILSAREVSSISSVGYHSDGAGLYLQVGRTGAKSWIFRYKLGGRPREMGLGSTASLKLADARNAAQDCRRLLQQGLDPIDARKEKRREDELAKAKSKTFKECSTEYIAAHSASWRNAKHRDQWSSTLKTYAYPVFGNRSIQDIDTTLVKRVLEPIWNTKTETATRVRGRIEAIIDWATVSNYRQGENPARWRGHLDHLLPKPSAVSTVTHHPALHYSKLPEFMPLLRAEDCRAAKGLEFLILTATRTGEVIGARWGEYDEGTSVWTIPAVRMKAKKPHRVPITSRAAKILDDLKQTSESEFIFPGRKPGKPISNMAFLQLLKRINRPDITAHGFRSTFRDWGAEQTDFSHDVIEMALAHTIGNKVEAAYRRGDLFEKRTSLMEAWAKYCEPNIDEADVLEARSA